jgi:hypothetical protein
MMNDYRLKGVTSYSKVSGELAPIDLTKLPKDLRAQLRLKESYVAVLR